MKAQREQGIFGVFKGMGDLLWASPVIRAELDRGVEIHLLVFHGETLPEICTLLDFGPQGQHLHLHCVPSSLLSPLSLLRFLAEMRTLSPRNIWISPHAPAADSSWRVPLLLWLIKQLFWRSAVLIGAASERLSMIFDRRLHIDRTLPLPRREWAAYCELRHNTALPEFAPSPAFITAISDVRHQPPAFDLVIHPGASAWNRIWPHEKYPVLLAALPAHWTIAFVGLPADLAAVQAAFPPGLSENYTFLVGSLQHALQIIASARRLLVMNSGTMHFAEVLGIPTVAIFGQQTPSDVIGEGNIVPVYQVSAPCQPCGRATCNQPHLYCLTNLDPLIVARQLTQLAPA